MSTTLRTASIILSVAAVAFCLAEESNAGALVKSGDKIAFLGDSITKQGNGPEGWCTLVISGLKTVGIAADAINAGRGGNTSRDMTARVEADVISKKPDWMTLLCGTNDNPNHGLSLEESKKNIAEIVGKAQAAGIKVLLITMPDRGSNLTENPYNESIRQFAREKAIAVADVFVAMTKSLNDQHSNDPTLPLSAHPLFAVPDGTHMNARGNQVIAQCVLESFGLSPDQVSQVKSTWPTIPPPGKDTPNVTK